VALEADVVARHLSGEPDDIRRGPVVQVYRDDETGRAAAAAFREALSRSGASELRDVRLPADGDPPDRILEEAAGGDPPTAVVLWLREPDLRRFADRTGGASWPGRTYLSSTLAGTAAPAALGAPKGTVYLAHPFALPTGKGERDRARLWLSARKVPRGEERLQNNAFFAAAIAVDAMDQMLDFFSRDYLLEKVEHMVENAVPPSSYPRLSLGPGQRFASKGSYLLRYAPETGGLVPEGDWIVPESR
jgi:ABC-type branched-subunit amino acid transport system substrate-binding protein